MTELTIQASEELIKMFLQNLENKLSVIYKDRWTAAEYLAWRASIEYLAWHAPLEGEEICLWTGTQYFTRCHLRAAIVETRSTYPMFALVDARDLIEAIHGLAASKVQGKLQYTLTDDATVRLVSRLMALPSPRRRDDVASRLESVGRRLSGHLIPDNNGAHEWRGETVFHAVFFISSMFSDEGVELLIRYWNAVSYEMARFGKTGQEPSIWNPHIASIFEKVVDQYPGVQGGLDGLCLPHAVAYASCALWSKARHYCTLINVDPLAGDPRANLIYGMEPHPTIAQANQAAFHGLILREWDKATISQHGALLAKKLKCNTVDVQRMTADMRLGVLCA